MKWFRRQRHAAKSDGLSSVPGTPHGVRKELASLPGCLLTSAHTPPQYCLMETFINKTGAQLGVVARAYNPSTWPWREQDKEPASATYKPGSSLGHTRLAQKTKPTQIPPRALHTAHHLEWMCLEGWVHTAVRGRVLTKLQNPGFLIYKEGRGQKNWLMLTGLQCSGHYAENII